MWSASQLNEYGICPYRFFARRLLGLEAVEEPEEGMNARQLGSMYHRILELTYEQIAAAGLTIQPDHAQEALRILDSVMDAVLPTAPTAFGFRASRLWAHEQAEHLRKLRAVVEADFGDKPPLGKLSQGTRTTLAHEAQFGGEQPVVLSGAAGALRFGGTIDRLDATPDGLIVVDYKSGSASFSQDDLLAGRNIQMLLYIHAARQLFPEIEVRGGAFWHLGNGRVSGAVNTATDAEALEDAADALHERILRGRQGEFTSTPSKPTGNGDTRKCASYCEYGQLCRMSPASSRKPLDG
jgi:ATP-dependent helicase/DNAse subunit B